MVHLHTVHGDDANASASTSGAHQANEANTLLKLTSEADEFTTSVYGSRLAEQDLPRLRMPEKAMPREIAYSMIKDDLSMDNNPKLK